jgi:tRNA pseudouridine32 synthase/23S rRNA pseudouridine746 synthase
LNWPLLHSSRLQAQEGPAFMQMQTLPGPPNAHTSIDLIQRLGQPLGADVGELAHYRLWPLTGRKHQLRVHLCELGMPIVGDRIYPVLWPDLEPGAAPDYTQPLQLLAREVSFTDPLSGRERRFASRRQLHWAQPQLLPDTKTL